ncbi:MAG: SGNH/GDSL hydrolase family protein [Saprospiraceae bacterium]|nr:SGNH/GDSL hydrolase family protein [Saprospiraceae bacterium]
MVKSMNYVMVFKRRAGSFFFFMMLIGLFISCSTNEIMEDPDDGIDIEPVEADYSLLFVGNSLTYTNNLPLLVKQAAEDRGYNIETRSLAYPNYAIVDHWADGQVQTLIKSKKYDFVIIQQGPSSQQEGHRMLIDSGADYAALCKENGAELAYYMVWPPVSVFHRFDRVIANYTDAARKNNAILCPVGRVWKDYIDQTMDYSYYGFDDFHPSLKGSQVAADVIISSLIR